MATKKTPPVPKPVTETSPEPVIELERIVNVVHKTTGKKFTVNRDYYLARKHEFDIA